MPTPRMGVNRVGREVLVGVLQWYWMEKIQCIIVCQGAAKHLGTVIKLIFREQRPLTQYWPQYCSWRGRIVL